MHEFDLKKIPEASEARRDAGRTLSVKGNRLLLALGVLTLLPSVMLYILLESTIACVVSIGEPIATDHTAFLWGNGLYYPAALLLTLCRFGWGCLHSRQRWRQENRRFWQTCLIPSPRFALIAERFAFHGGACLAFCASVSWLY